MTMNFERMRNNLIKHFEEMVKDETKLFEVELDKDKLWETYLNSFPKGTNPIYRERTEHDCSCCRQFIKGIGNVVTIKDNKIETLWDFKDEEYQPVLDQMSSFVKNHMVENIFVTNISKYGTYKNYESLEDGKIIEYKHFCLEIPNKFICRTPNETRGEAKAIKGVFKRSLEEITEDAILTVLELISSNTLYRGMEWEKSIKQLLSYKKSYEKLKNDVEKNNFLWYNSTMANVSVSKIKNHSIGTLLVNISEGMDLETAVSRYEQITAPTNYKRPKAIFTKKMLEDAERTITELGYLDSLPRRFANINDITINNILFANKDVTNKLSSNIFDEMKSDAVSKPKTFNKVQEITIEDFISNVLPKTTKLEVYFENKHLSNMVSLIAPENKNANTMFKWDNNFSWSYNGNATDSYIKENVKMAGGDVHGILRCSIQWNDGIKHNMSDYDLHCVEPNKNEIYFGNKGYRHNSSGMLDVDIMNPIRNVPAVENITYSDINKMQKGTYKFFVHDYCMRSGDSGFKAEIEFNGQIYSFEYDKPLRTNEEIYIADVIFNGETFEIVEKLPSNVSSKEIWGLKTNEFVPVSVVMNSPNYWNEQIGIGNKHYFFMLKDCINPDTPNGFYNEFLKNELSKHKRVFEALGSKMKVKETNQQLSGLGFSSTKRNELIVRTEGKTKRIFKVKF